MYSGFAPLHVAAALGTPEAVQALLLGGADGTQLVDECASIDKNQIDKPSVAGKTPYEVAKLYNNEATASLLLEHLAIQRSASASRRLSTEFRAAESASASEDATANAAATPSTRRREGRNREAVLIIGSGSGEQGRMPPQARKCTCERVHVILMSPPCTPLTT